MMESTRETAEMAASLTLLTIMESAVPIKAVKICSQIRGIIRASSWRPVYMWPEAGEEESFVFIGMSMPLFVTMCAAEVCAAERFLF